MKIYFVAAILLAITQTCYSQIEYDRWENALNIRSRMLEQMKSAHHEMVRRIKTYNNMRFMYEDNPEYEQGYIFGEIIDRYRRIVELTRWLQLYKGETVYSYLVRLKYSHRGFLELDHLVNMMHEIPNKYAHLKTLEDELKEDEGAISVARNMSSLKQILDKQRLYMAEKKRNLTIAAKIHREKYVQDTLKRHELGGQLTMRPRGRPYVYYQHDEYPDNKYQTPRIKNPFFPKDYGWEIDRYDWIASTPEPNVTEYQNFTMEIEYYDNDTLNKGWGSMEIQKVMQEGGVTFDEEEMMKKHQDKINAVQGQDVPVPDTPP